MNSPCASLWRAHAQAFQHFTRSCSNSALALSNKSGVWYSFAIMISFQCHFIYDHCVFYALNTCVYFVIDLCFCIALKERSYFALVEIYFHLISDESDLWSAEEEEDGGVTLMHISRALLASVLVVTVLLICGSECVTKLLGEINCRIRKPNQQKSCG